MHPRPLAITVSFLCMLKSPFLHSVENWIKCDDTILLQQGAKKIFDRGQGCSRHYQGVGGIRCWVGRVQNHFSDGTLFFIFNLKILPILFCWVSRCHLKALFTKVLRSGLTFWNIWIQKLQNWVRSCQHIVGTPCTSVSTQVIEIRFLKKPTMDFKTHFLLVPLKFKRLDHRRSVKLELS